MNLIFEAAIQVQSVCRAASFQFCFIGGLAVQRWGQPRMTADVDLTVVTGFGSEAPFVDILLAHLSPRAPDARQFALDHRTLLVRASNGIDVDIALGAMPFEERAAARASDFDLGVGVVTTCSAEDLIVHKAFANRDKDWLDIAGIAARRRAHLDREQIWAELSPLLELRDDPSIEPRLQKLLR